MLAVPVVCEPMTAIPLLPIRSNFVPTDPSTACPFHSCLSCLRRCPPLRAILRESFGRRAINRPSIPILPLRSAPLRSELLCAYQFLPIQYSASVAFAVFPFPIRPIPSNAVFATRVPRPADRLQSQRFPAFSSHCFDRRSSLISCLSPLVRASLVVSSLIPSSPADPIQSIPVPSIAGPAFNF